VKNSFTILNNLCDKYCRARDIITAKIHEEDYTII
jgi:hypothetical protein